jgi:Tat protein translocase TatB subunit
MFGPLGVQEILLIFAIVLIVFGPRRIPEIGRTLGKFMAEFRKATDDFKGTIEREVRLEELKNIAPEMTTPYESVSRTEPETYETPTAPAEPFPIADMDAPAEPTTPEPEPEPAAPRADVTNG